jgi:SAM-dependent methyltransferase
VSFAAGPEAYDRFMGRYSAPLAPKLADFAAITPGQRVLDVGCGPGALTAVLAERLGAEAVTAVDPSASFVATARDRHPGATVECAPAERLPFDDREFDAALAELVVHFMADPMAGLREMARVTRARGVVAACVWDHGGGGHGPLSVFWDAARKLDPDVRDESQLAGAHQGHLAKLFKESGLDEVEESSLWIEVGHPNFDDWWEPFLLGVGPAGSFVAGLDPERQVRLRELCREMLPSPSFVVTARAWAARGFA